VLDLGAGTGNATSLLAEREAHRLVVAIDNNPVMLSMLRDKCAPFLREDAQGPGVIAIKQDISSLYGLDVAFDSRGRIRRLSHASHPQLRVIPHLRSNGASEYSLICRTLRYSFSSSAKRLVRFRSLPIWSSTLNTLQSLWGSLKRNSPPRFKNP
jgi:SAM-dependent methyltransferase